MSAQSRSTSESETPFALALPKIRSPSETLSPGAFNRLQTFCTAVAVPRDSMKSPAPTTATTAIATIVATVCFHPRAGVGTGGDGASTGLYGGGRGGPLGGGHGADERLRSKEMGPPESTSTLTFPLPGRAVAMIRFEL
jgi:hypothetical protein